MHVVWLSRARQDLGRALRYTERNDPAAARTVEDRILTAIRKLPDFPRIGRPGRVAGTRELVITRTPYIVAYQVSGEAIRILAIIHGARRWTKTL